jgi:hypothetical protein
VINIDSIKCSKLHQLGCLCHVRQFQFLSRLSFAWTCKTEEYKCTSFIVTSSIFCYSSKQISKNIVYIEKQILNDGEYFDLINFPKSKFRVTLIKIMFITFADFCCAVYSIVYAFINILRRLNEMLSTSKLFFYLLFHQLN